MSIIHFAPVGLVTLSNHQLTVAQSGNIFGYNRDQAYGALVPDTLFGVDVRSITNNNNIPGRLTIQTVEPPTVGKDFFNSIRFIRAGDPNDGLQLFTSVALGGPNTWSWDGVIIGTLTVGIWQVVFDA
jgi:hypothetical protein